MKLYDLVLIGSAFYLGDNKHRDASEARQELISHGNQYGGDVFMHTFRSDNKKWNFPAEAEIVLYYANYYKRK